MSAMSHLRAVISVVVITANLIFWCVPVLILGFLKWAIPPLSRFADVGLEWIYRSAVKADDVWLKGVLGLNWNDPSLGLAADENVVVLSNHVSWADILLIQSVVARYGPILKFLTKRELIYFPIFGAIFWAYDFPLLRRKPQERGLTGGRRRSDLESITEACLILKQRPAALVCFAEGTRMTEEKRHRTSSPYAHLLAPKVGGFLGILEALDRDKLRVVDLTIKYPEAEHRSFWAFIGGRAGRIEIDATVIEAREIPESREGRIAWLAERWAIKDRKLASVQG